MASRRRLRTGLNYRTWDSTNNGTRRYTDYGPTTLEVIDDVDASPPPFSNNPVTHIRVDRQATGIIHETLSSTTRTTYGVEAFGTTGHGRSIVDDLIMPIIGSFVKFKVPEFQKNNNFELLTFLSDLDDTVGMFTWKFWKQINYGSVNWGLAPFVSDLKSLHATLDDIFNGKIDRALKSPGAIERTFPVKYPSGLDKVRPRTFEGSLRLTGVHSITPPSSSVDQFSILADELGIHPDLRTIWDVIPLSFVLDYFLPVGDMLESVHPRGWYSPENKFSGSATLKGKWTQRVSADGKHADLRAHGRYYRRGIPLSFTSSAQHETPIEWESPEPKELFNTAYLALQKRRGGRVAKRISDLAGLVHYFPSSLKKDIKNVLF